MYAGVLAGLNSDSLNFDTSVCNVHMMPPEDIELRPCSSRAAIKTQCLDAERTETGCS